MVFKCNLKQVFFIRVYYESTLCRNLLIYLDNMKLLSLFLYSLKETNDSSFRVKPIGSGGRLVSWLIFLRMNTSHLFIVILFTLL